jgi:hypothetical protein
MSTTTIPVSECYALHIHTSTVLATSERHLRITSTFTGAKDPSEQRKLFDVTLSPAHFNQLAAAIKGTP